MIPADKTQTGFTLIETIITLVISAIFAAMLFAYVYSVPKSTAPIQRLQNVFSLQQSMEKIIADYNAGIAACSPSCTSALLTTLQTNINNKQYGSYTIQTNGCVTLASGTEAASNCTSTNASLKVVIQDTATGLTFGALFTY